MRAKVGNIFQKQVYNQIQISIDEVFDHFQQIDVDASGKVGPIMPTIVIRLSIIYNLSTFITLIRLANAN